MIDRVGFKSDPAPTHFHDFPNLNRHLRAIYDAMTNVRHGKMDCCTEVTLRANQATTVLTFNHLSAQSIIHFDPTTANAAAELYGATMYVTAANRGNGQCTITHANNAQTDRTFYVSVIG